MLLYATIRRHLCLTLVALSLCQAFVTSSRFGMLPFIRGGAAATPLSSSDKKDASSRVGPLGVLRAPPPSSTTRRTSRANGGGADEEADTHQNNKNNSVLMNGSSARRNGVSAPASTAYSSNGKIRQVPNQEDLYAPPDDATAAPQTTTTAFGSQQVEYVAETKLPTDVGAFQLRGYRIPGAPPGQEPCVIYCRDKPPFGQDGVPSRGVPVRIHDQCLTSEVFRSQR